MLLADGGCNGPFKTFKSMMQQKSDFVIVNVKLCK